MKLESVGSLQLPGLLTADINGKDQILARVTRDDRSKQNVQMFGSPIMVSMFRCQIKVIDRFSVDVPSVIASECIHASACLIAHPTDVNFVLEGCDTCRMIRNYNIHNGQNRVVYTGCAPIKMCQGPTGSILILDKSSFFSMALRKFTWDKEKRQMNPDERVFVQSGLLEMCYSERFDMFVIISGPGEIVAVRLDCDVSAKKSSSVVIDHIWKSLKAVRVGGGYILNFVRVASGYICKLLRVDGLNIWNSLGLFGGHIWKSLRIGDGHIWKSLKPLELYCGYIWRSLGLFGGHIWKSLRIGDGHIWKSLKPLELYCGYIWKSLGLFGGHIWKSLRIGDAHIWKSLKPLELYCGYIWRSLGLFGGHIWKSMRIGDGRIWKSLKPLELYCGYI